ncbi:probable phospholipase A2 homolog 2 [Zingiber officinale]|uniref:probable phospholipase A2 homolog 2 n=1 Tax=Zingiber officinale TaxID=94328 RepID=UPI001C4D2E04|nr:probable phospholipase A2 homolog 2 [Zingiber officinale]
MRSQRERFPVSLVTCFLLLPLAVFFHRIAASDSDAHINCSRRCVAENCNTIGIRYGKFCGVGWTGCPGEKPCDELDACCKAHDECVEKKGWRFCFLTSRCFFFYLSIIDLEIELFCIPPE